MNDSKFDIRHLQNNMEILTVLLFFNKILFSTNLSQEVDSSSEYQLGFADFPRPNTHKK